MDAAPESKKWGQKLFLYSAVKACMTFFTFVESRGYAFLNPNTVHNQLRITEESWLLLYFILWRQWKNTKTKTLKCYKIFPVVRRKSPHELWQTQQSMNPFATLSSTKNQINNSVLKNRKTNSSISFCGGGEDWVVLLPNRKKPQPIFLLEQLRWLPLKPLILRQKGTQRTCLRLPSLTYWVFIPAPRVCTGVRQLGRTLGLRCAPTPRSARIYIKYISVVFALILA